tara:strand:- start:197 stop:1252 length:1056 start_codon:yes stop_codon:yes gene_type:complete
MPANTSASESNVERWLGDLSDIEKVFTQEVQLINLKESSSPFKRGKCIVSKRNWDQSDYYISLGTDARARKFLAGVNQTLVKSKLEPNQVQFTIFVQNVLTREYAELASFECSEIENKLDQESEGSLIKIPHHSLMQSTDTGFDLGVVIYMNESRSFEALMPWQKGTWLDQAIFEVRCKEKEEAAEVNYLKLTKELRTEWEIHRSVSHYITFDGNPLSSEYTDEDLRFYLDEKILEKFDDIPNNAPTGERHRLERETLAAEARLVQIMRAHTLFAGENLSEIEGSVIYKIIHELSYQKDDKDLEQSEKIRYFELLKNDPYKLFTDYVNVSIMKKKNTVNVAKRLTDQITGN